MGEKQDVEVTETANNAEIEVQEIAAEVEPVMALVPAGTYVRKTEYKKVSRTCVATWPLTHAATPCRSSHVPPLLFQSLLRVLQVILNTIRSVALAHILSGILNGVTIT